MPTAFRLLITALLLSACSVASPTPGVAGRTFLSTVITEGGVDRPLVPGTRIRLTFGDDGQLGVNAGCNHFGATYGVDGGVLRINGGAMTEMGCDDARHAQDDWIFDFLSSGPRIELSGNELALIVGDVVIRLVDAEVAEPDQPLVGPVWTVASIRSGEVVSSVPVDVTATLQFAADGTVLVNAGCNVGNARIEGDAEVLRFREIVLTRRGCDGRAAQLEASVLSVLEAPEVTATIDASTLTLDTDGAGLVLTADRAQSGEGGVAYGA